MLNKIAKTSKIVSSQARLFSYNYANAAHPKVYMEVTKDGQSAGRLVFELYESHAPQLAENFHALCTDEGRSIVGTTFNNGAPGMGIQGGNLNEAENWGSSKMRLADENLEIRHHKRGLLTMVNSGSHSNGSQFMVTFDETNYLNGYNNVIGELVEGESLLADMESSCQRYGEVSAKWTVSAAGSAH